MVDVGNGTIIGRHGIRSNRNKAVTTSDFLSYLRAQDIEVWADGERLRCNAPREVLTDELLAEISRRKAEILSFLQIAAACAQSSPCLIPLQPEGNRPPIFGVPGHNGDVFCFLPLARHLGRDQPFFGLQPPGTDGKQAPIDDAEKLAAYFVGEIRAVQPEGPYFLGGYCLGGIVAFEMARQLQAAGQTVALLALFGTTCPTAFAFPHRAGVWVRRYARRVLKWAGELSELSLVEKFRHPINKWKLRQAEQKKRAAKLALNPYRRQVEQATVRASRSYRLREFSGRITVCLAGPKPANLQDDRLLDWKNYALQGIDTLVGPPDCTGDSMLREPYARVFADLMRSLEALEKTATNAGASTHADCRAAADSANRDTHGTAAWTVAAMPDMSSS
jgi:thioesterase domain-containing protein